MEVQYEKRVGSNHPFVPFHREDVERSIPDRFEKQVRFYSDRLAVKTTRHRLTYAELNRLANQVAHAILDTEGKSNRPVALLFAQGATMIAASLGALKAGKVYTPVDDSLPPGRQVSIVRDIRAHLIITDNENLSAAHNLAQETSNVINIDNLNCSLPDTNPGIFILPDQLACIHYTSGSTGEPKGVVQNHRNELHNIMTNTNALHISAEDRISLVRSNNVGATRDALAALLNGAAIISLNLKKEGLANVAEWLLAEEISLYTCVTTVFRHSLGAVASNVQFPSVRLIHVGGEPVYRTDLELYKSHFSPECVFVSRLGVSETETLTYYFAHEDTEIEGDVVPVGYPLEGNEILLLDDDQKEVGAEQVGEIAVRSQYLAVGYWRRPELTGARFLPDPKGGTRRLYLTGDLGCIRPDGCLMHMGRKDTQVKIRGHRVETSEVETALLDIPTIQQAAVMLRQDSDNKLLVAYVVPRTGQTLGGSQLRQSLRDKLPSYMIPSTFVFLASLPTTSGGKVDRRALPLPDRSRATLDTPYVSPRTPVESVIVNLWSEIIETTELGIDDDLWELGGHSLLAAQIAARLHASFGLQLPADIFHHAPTPAKLAEWLVNHEPRQGQTERIAKIFLQVEEMSEEDIRTTLERERGNG